MELTDLLDEYGIEYITSGQDSSKEFVNIHCSVGCLENSTYKRGIRRDLSSSTCWVCGEYLNGFQTAKHLGIPWGVWKSVQAENSSDDYKDDYVEFDADMADITVPGSPYLSDEHKQYLAGRGLDWKFLQKYFGVRGSLNEGDWVNRNRIIIPIRYDGVTISYLGRSFLENPTNRRYMVCPPEDEGYFHKSVFFNMDLAQGKKVILVEGSFDAFKLIQASGNFNIIASFGTAITKEQLALLKEVYDEVIILYDNEPLAQKNANKIVSYMRTFGKKAKSVCLKKWNDPGGMPLDMAKFLVDKLLGE